MTSRSRRRFLGSIAAAGASRLLPRGLFAAAVAAARYPAIDLSYFDKPITPLPSPIAVAYHTITWGGHEEQGLQEIAELGYSGAQCRASVVQEYGGDPQRFRDLLKSHHIRLVALSSGPVAITGEMESEIEKHLRNARFLRDVHGYYLQVTDSARSKDRQPEAADYRELSRRLTEIGRRSADLGVRLGYHPHMHTLGETPQDAARILDATDPRAVRLFLDVAHYRQGGGDPAEAIRVYHDRLLSVHLKDVQDTSEGIPGSDSFRFVELGQGRVDLPAVLAALKQVAYRGWVIIELDKVTSPTRSAKESAALNKAYVEGTLGLRV